MVVLSPLTLRATIYISAARAADGPRKGSNPLLELVIHNLLFLAHAADYGRHERARPFPGKEGVLCPNRPSSLRPARPRCRMRPASNGCASRRSITSKS